MLRTSETRIISVYACVANPYGATHHKLGMYMAPPNATTKLSNTVATWKTKMIIAGQCIYSVVLMNMCSSYHSTKGVALISLHYREQAPQQVRFGEQKSV